MACDRGVAVAVGHFDCFKGFCEGANLVYFDENCVSCSFFDSLFKEFNVCYEKVVAYKLGLTIKKDGTKYIVTLEPRKINNISNDNNIYNVVAKKDAIIKKIIASSGDVLKNTNDYVKKGDVIVSSNIMLYDNLKNRVSAKATIYGEAWYKIHIEYPLNYYEEVETGNKKVIYNHCIPRK